MPLFTAENAATYGKQGALARWSKPPPTAIEPPIATPVADDDKARALSRTRAQMERIDSALDVCDDAKDWDALTRAKERLFRAWVHLAGIPGPGQRKPAPERQRPTKAQSPLAEE